MDARAGEIIGLSGLAAHGQSQLLVRIFQAAERHDHELEVTAAVAVVAGDRQTDGVSRSGRSSKMSVQDGG
jgi:ribose transport system ATP-binding protein